MGDASSPTDVAVAVIAALASAATFGLTGTLQHEATWRVRRRAALQPGLLVDLAHQPLWLLSLGTSAIGVALQWIALANGPLLLVQPLLVTGVLFAVSFSGLIRRQKPDRIVITGAAMCAAGLAAFLLIANPTATRAATVRLPDVLPFSAALAVILVGCVHVAARHRGRPRTLALAVGAGVLYGVTAGMIRVAMHTLESGVTVMLTSWPIYVVAVCGPLGFLLNQNAFQAGVALAPALALIVVLDPLVGIGIAILWLGETVRSGWLPAFGEIIALAVLIAGVVILSHRAPQVAAQTSGNGGWRTGIA
jgi:drug/metabolite transporter (DMT)-like permease